MPPTTYPGEITFADGSRVLRSGQRPGKWIGRWADGTPLRGEDPNSGFEWTSYFDSPQEVAAAIAAGGEGPAAGLMESA